MAKAIKPKDNMEVLELEAEEIPLEKQIENTLVKHNVTETVIAGLKEKYGGMVLRSVDNKEDFLTIKEARNDVRKYGILCEKICKAGRQSAIEIQKLWLSKEKQVLGKIAEVQDPLEAEIKKYEDEQARIELEEVRKRENAFATRQSELIKMGATYMDGSYSLNHVSFEADTIKSADQETYENSILPKFKAQFEKNEAIRIEEDRKREEAAESLRIAQEEMAAKQKEMDEREAAFKLAEEQRLAAIRQQNEEAEKIRREEEESRAAAERKRRTELQTTRLNQLLPVNPYGADVDMATLWSLDESKFNEILQTKTAEFEKKKKADEEAKLARIEKEKQEAIAAAALAERQKIEREQREAKEKADREAAAKAEEALKASDKQKWQSFIAGIGGVVIPDMKSPIYKNKIEDARKLLAKIIGL